MSVHALRPSASIERSDEPAQEDGAPTGLLELRPLVPEGQYQLSYCGHETAKMFGKAPKLIVRFKLCEPGEHFGTVLARYYNIRDFVGRPGPSGRFKASASGDLAIEFCNLFGATGRLDRISLEPFRTKIVLGTVRTVTMNAAQRTLPQPIRYSVISHLHSVVKT